MYANQERTTNINGLKDQKFIILGLNIEPFQKEVSGEVLSEIHLQSGDGKTMCRYPDDTIPERYTTFNTVGLPNRVNAKGIRNAWMVVANIADHRTMIGLAALRRAEHS